MLNWLKNKIRRYREERKFQKWARSNRVHHMQNRLKLIQKF